jgi:hypothetical protein
MFFKYKKPKGESYLFLKCTSKYEGGSHAARFKVYNKNQ